MSLGMQEILPDGGLASFQNEVSKLADLGRYEDAYIVHAAEGETIVPMAVFDENPRLKAMLFAQMRGMGIDPQRYICLLYTSPSPRDVEESRMPSSA